MITGRIACCGICLATLSVSGCVNETLPVYLPIPADLREKRVLVGQGFLEKSVFLEIPYHTSDPPGVVTSIRWAHIPDEGSEAIAILERHRGAHFADPHTAEVWSTIALDDACASAAFVNVQRDGTPQIMCRGAEWGAVSLYDTEGQLLWTKGETLLHSLPWDVAVDMAAGDSNDDGVVEFYVARYGSLACYDASGVELWTARRLGRDKYRNIELMHDDDGHDFQIIASLRGHDWSGFLEFRNAEGNLVRRVDLPSSSTLDFRVIRWPLDGGSPAILTREDSTVLVLDMDGHVLFEHAVALGWEGRRIEGTVVRFGDDGDAASYLAVLFDSWEHWDRSLLMLFSTSGNLVYQEILGEGTGMLAANLPDAEGFGEVLLVSDGPGKIASYRWTGAAPD